MTTDKSMSIPSSPSSATSSSPQARFLKDLSSLLTSLSLPLALIQTHYKERKAHRALVKEFLASQAREVEMGIPPPPQRTLDETIILLLACRNRDAGLRVSARDLEELQLMTSPPPTPRFSFGEDEEEANWKGEIRRRYLKPKERRRAKISGTDGDNKTPNAIQAVQSLNYERMLVSGVCRAFEGEGKLRRSGRLENLGTLQALHVNTNAGPFPSPGHTPNPRPVIVRRAVTQSSLPFPTFLPLPLPLDMQMKPQLQARARKRHTMGGGYARPPPHVNLPDRPEFHGHFVCSTRSLDFTGRPCEYGTRRYEKRYVSLVGASVAIMEDVRMNRI